MKVYIFFSPCAFTKAISGKFHGFIWHCTHTFQKKKPVNCMNDLTVEQVIAFHKQVMKTDDGDDRLLSEAGLHQMVFSANRIEDIYPVAALAFFSLVAYPAFREGNSRTAQLMADMILNHNGCTLKDGDADMTPLVQRGLHRSRLNRQILKSGCTHIIKTSDP